MDDKKLRSYDMQNPKELLKILEERLPISCLIYKQVVQWEKFREELQFYTIGKAVDSETRIFSNNIREDYPYNHGISAPTCIATSQISVPLCIRECFSSDGFINWDNTTFISVATPIANMIVNVCANENGNVTEIQPCCLFYMYRESALKLTIDLDDPKVQVRRLDASNTRKILFLTLGLTHFRVPKKPFPNAFPEMRQRAYLWKENVYVAFIYQPLDFYRRFTQFSSIGKEDTPNWQFTTHFRSPPDKDASRVPLFTGKT